MTRSLNSDPLRNFRFIVTINHPALPSLMRLGFMAVTGLSVQNEIIPYREGGNNTTALPLDAPVLTVNGWKKMGELEVGDRLVDPRGEDSKIVDILPAGRKAVYRVTLQDGSMAEACYGHLWEVDSRDANNRRKTQVVTTLMMKELVEKRGYQVLLPKISPVQYDAMDELPLDPYLLGVLLSEGSLELGGISFAQDEEDGAEVIERVREALPGGHHLVTHYQDGKNGGLSTKHRISVGNTGGAQTSRITYGRNLVLCAVRELGLLGHRAWEKFIPEVYLRGTIEERLDLLRGIMDGDGWVDENGCIMFSSSSEKLTQGVRELVLSLGGRCRIVHKTNCSYTYEGVRRASRDKYIISGFCGFEFNPFHMHRKAARVLEPSPKSDSYSRKVVSVEYLREDVVQCIAVSASSHLFISHDFVPSHNTRKMPGQSDFGPVSFTRGMMAQPVGSSTADGTDSIYKWFTQIFSVVAGGGFGGGNVDFRVNVNVDVLAHPVTFGPGSAGTSITPPIKARFQVFYAWPMSLSYSDLEAGGNAVIIENLTLAHEGWLLLSAANNDLRTFLSSSAGVGTVVSTA